VSILLMIIILQIEAPASPSEQASHASESFLSGDYGNAAALYLDLLSRMPHMERLAYNGAAALFQLDSLALADSLLRGISPESVEPDTLNPALATAGLARAIAMEDYGAVQSSVNTLRDLISSGISRNFMKTALEAGINWLNHHEPPEDQQNQDNQDNQDQDDSQDQDESQDREDSQDQNDQDQSDSEDQEDQDQDQDDQDQSDSEDQEDQDQDDREQDDSPDQAPQPPPSIDEMTPEQAQAILDLVEEDQAAEDSLSAGKAGFNQGPVW